MSKNENTIIGITEDGQALTVSRERFNDPEEKRFEPYQKVLMAVKYSRREDKSYWKADFYSHYARNLHHGVAISSYHCIPYKGNEALRGKEVIFENGRLKTPSPSSTKGEHCWDGPKGEQARIINTDKAGNPIFGVFNPSFHQVCAVRSEKGNTLIIFVFSGITGTDSNGEKYLHSELFLEPSFDLTNPYKIAAGINRDFPKDKCFPCTDEEYLLFISELKKANIETFNIHYNNSKD